MFDSVKSNSNNTVSSRHTWVQQTRLAVMMFAIIFLNACGLSVTTKIVAELAQGSSRDPVITEAEPAPPKAGNTVVLTGTKFPVRTKNVIARVVLADGGTKDSALTVTSVTSATFTVPTDTASEVKTILMMHDGKTMATFDIKVTPVGTFDALTFSPAAGTYAGTQSVTIASTQPGATIYYTTDDSTPTTNSAVYTATITVAASETITAYAAKTGFTDSAAASAAYVINGAVQTPVATVAGGAYSNNQSVTLATLPMAASIYYTTDGSSPSTSSTLYTGTISITGTTTLKAIAAMTNYLNSAVMTKTYTLTAAAPTMSVATGTYTSPQSATLSSTTSGAAIYYTTNSSTPTSSSTLYTTAIAISSTQTLKAIATKANYTDSGVTSTLYTINLTTVSTPTFSPAAGGYGPAQSVTISTITAGATIYYTTNNTTPTTGSSVYSTPITVSATQTLQAYAVKGGLIDSGVGVATFTINGAVSTPTFSVAQGSYGPAQSVTISSATAGATIYYTTDNSTPTTSSSVYSTAINVSSTQTLNAYAVKANYTDSGVASAAYTINGAVQTPVPSVTTGGFSNNQSVTLATVPMAASIYYTIDGSTPTTSSTLYTGAITIAGTTTLKALGVMTAYSNSTVMTETYTLTVATPTVDIEAGAYGPSHTVTLSSTTTGVVMHYTTDGTTPTCSSATGPVSVTATMAVKAIACKANYTDSAVATFAYTINGAVVTPTMSVTTGTYNNNQSVTITSATAGASIYYTTDGSTPDNTKILYSGTITISGPTTLKAIAAMTNYSNSGVITETYTLTAATPTADIAAGSYGPSQTVTLSSATTGATFRYTMGDGSQADPDCSTGSTANPMTVSATATIKAIACKTSYTDSSVVSFAYTINGVVATPILSVTTGTYNNNQTVTLSSATAGASIYYTTDGSTPDNTKTLYSGAITISATTIFKAIAIKSTYSNSAVASETYTMLVSAPSADIAPGTYYINQSVTLTSATTTASIRYTTDSSTPACPATGSLYAAPVTISSSSTLKYIACQTGYTSSSVQSNTYTVIVATAPVAPVIADASKAFNASFATSIQQGVPADVIFKEFRFTTNGVDPTCSSGSASSAQPTTSSIPASTTTLKTITCNLANLASPVATAVYSYDTSAPAAIIASSTAAITNLSPIPITITFSESVTGFDVSDALVTNAVKSGFSGSGASYSLNVTPSAQGIVTVNIAANAAQDAAGNGNTVASELSRTFDSEGPIFTGLSITSSSPSSTNFTPTVEFTLNEAAVVTLYSDSGCSTSVSSASSKSSGVNTNNTNILSGSAVTSIYIKGVDNLGNSSSCLLIGSYTTQLAAPTLSSPIRYVQSLGLSWTSETGAASYNLYWSTAPGVSASSNSLTGVTSVYAHNSLTGGATYYYRVAAVKNSVLGALSTEVSNFPYTYAAPTVTTISPSSGSIAGGTTVTITGTGFQSGVAVAIGGSAPTAVTLVSSTSMTAITPSGAFGAQNVDVTNSDGQSASVAGGFTFTCPTNYVKVSANLALGTSDFCISKYEMKNVSGVATSQAALTPWVTITRSTATTQCQAYGAKYDLTSNFQWQALARDIETVQNPLGTYLNWSNNSTSGSNSINRGHSDNSPANTLAASTDNDPCYGTGNTNCANNAHTDFTQKRTHTLKSGDVIWDVGGNAWEWVKNINTSARAPDGFVAIENSWDADDKLNFGPEGTYTSKNTGEYGGFGQAWLNYSAGDIFRGGRFMSGTNAGVFATVLTGGAFGPGNDYTFRCVISP